MRTNKLMATDSRIKKLEERKSIQNKQSGERLRALE